MKTALLFILLLLPEALIAQTPHSTMGMWQFAATCDTPSSQIDGGLSIVLDSATFVIGALKIEKKIEPLRGRNFSGHLLARTDSGFKPSIRLDLTLDSTGDKLNGFIDVGTVTAVDHHHRKKDFRNVRYLVYAIRKH